MDVRILGPLEVRRGDRLLPVGTGKQRALLTLLVLHRNEVVPTDRLVEELWGEHPPETAAKIVQNYVSLLRRSLAAGDGDAGDVIVTEGHGYTLRLGPGELDVDRFEELLARGRKALAAGKAEEAAQHLREALSLWRGPALADVAYEEFSQREIARLDERRLAALECRVEAELELARHADVVAELESLVAGHPLQERLRGLLMLALYRSGRQADALEVYQEGRRKLVGELGIEPSRELRELEQAILRQDPSLAAPLPARAGLTRALGRRRTLAFLGVPALLAAAGLSYALLPDSETEHPARQPPVVVAANSIAVIDPRTNEVTDSIPVGAGPGPIAVGEGAVWVANVQEHTLVRIDPSTREVVSRVGLGIEPTGLAVDDGAVWIAGGFDRVLLRVDTDSNRVTLRLQVREEIGPLPAGYEVGPSGVAVGEGSVWLAHGEEVSKIDRASGEVLATIAAGGNWSGAITAGEGFIWVAENDALKTRLASGDSPTGVAKIDPVTESVAARIALAGFRVPQTAGVLPPGALTASDGSLWAASPASDVVWRVDAMSDRVSNSVEGGREPASVAAGEGGVWVENHADETVTRIDPFSDRLVATIRIGRPTRGIAAGAGAVWVSVVR